MRDYVSYDIAVFVNCPSRQESKYVLGITDHATKYIWVYPMNERSEAFMYIKNFVDVKLRVHGCLIKHYYADGGRELIRKSLITLLSNLGALFTWSRADTPELSGVLEKNFKTLGERSLTMMLQSGLPTDFW